MQKRLKNTELTHEHDVLACVQYKPARL